MKPTQARLAALARLARAPGGPPSDERAPDRYLWIGTVITVNASPKSLDIDRHGTTIPTVNYLDSLVTPVAGDVVLCEFIGDAVICWGRYA